jgi:hypothetical protein
MSNPLALTLHYLGEERLLTLLTLGIPRRNGSRCPRASMPSSMIRPHCQQLLGRLSTDNLNPVTATSKSTFSHHLQVAATPCHPRSSPPSTPLLPRSLHCATTPCTCNTLRPPIFSPGFNFDYKLHCLRPPYKPSLSHLIPRISVLATRSTIPIPWILRISQRKGTLSNPSSKPQHTCRIAVNSRLYAI